MFIVTDSDNDIKYLKVLNFIKTSRYYVINVNSSDAIYYSFILSFVNLDDY